MKYHFQNIGPVKKAELELGNLTIIAGHNNTGKTYIAHTLYSFLTDLRWRVFLLAIRKSSLKERNLLEEAPPFNPKRENGKILVSQKEAENFFRHAIKKLAEEFSADLHTLYASAAARFSGATFSCEIPDIPIRPGKHVHYFRDKAQTTITLKGEEFEILIERNPEMPSDEEVSDSETPEAPNDKEIAAQEMLIFYAFQATSPSAFCFVAERMSIPIFYKELDFSRSSKFEALQKTTDKSNADEDIKKAVDALLGESARYRKPIKDNIDLTRDIENVQKKDSDFVNSELLGEVVNLIGGRYAYANNQIMFYAKPNGGEEKPIPLHETSSSVQCFALLYFYLRHVAKKGQLLIIDEPESHLDTVNQIKLARLLARCVNAGIKVLVTTHSDYFLKEINNLIMFSNDFEDKTELMEKFGYGENEPLKEEDIKAYNFVDGDLTLCDTDHRGMDMPMFDDVINSISAVSKALSRRLPESE